MKFDIDIEKSLEELIGYLLLFFFLFEDEVAGEN